MLSCSNSLVPNFERRTKKEPLSHSLHHQPNEKVEAREPKVTLLWILVLIRFLEAVFVCDAKKEQEVTRKLIRNWVTNAQTTRVMQERNAKSPIRVITPREELLGGSDESHEIVFSDFVTKVECYLLLNSFCILCSSVSHQHQQQVLPCLQKAMGQTRAIKALPHHSRLPMEENEDIMRSRTWFQKMCKQEDTTVTNNKI